MWICRAGYEASFLEIIKEQKRIYIPWVWLKTDFNGKSFENIKSILHMEYYKEGNVSSTASQIDAFVNKMCVGDYVMVPSKYSKAYILAKIIGEYEYIDSDLPLSSSRRIEILYDNISRDIFSDEIFRKLNAFKSIYRIHNETEVINCINKSELHAGNKQLT